MTPREFSQAMKDLYQTYNVDPVGDRALEAYHLVMGPLDLSVWVATFRVLVMTSKFFPKPSEIVDAVLSILDRYGVLPPTADEAWTAILAAVRRWHPAWNPPVLDDAARLALNATGGWRKIAMADDDQVVWIRKEFMASYDGFRRQGILDTFPVIASIPLPPAVSSLPDGTTP